MAAPQLPDALWDVVNAVRSALSGLEPGLRMTVSTMPDVRWDLLATERFRVALLLAFAGRAVFLALVGIFGLVAYTVDSGSAR